MGGLESIISQEHIVIMYFLCGGFFFFFSPDVGEAAREEKFKILENQKFRELVLQIEVNV